jgi:phospholipase C
MQPLHPRHEERARDHPIPYGLSVTRRRFLERSAMAVAGGVLFACTGGRPIHRVTDTPSTRVDTRWPVKRVIYLMLENRSFNNIFGRFPGVERSLTGLRFGEEVPLGRCPEWLPGDLPHDRAAHLNNVNGGRYDGFGIGLFGDPWAYTVFEEPQLPNYWLWAREYAISDRFFASVGGPSYPNHFFFIAGQSGGTIDNPENIETLPPPEGMDFRFKSWGCDAVGDDVFVFVKDEKGNLTKHDSCFTFRTVPEQLSEIGVSWAYYAAQPGQVGYFWNALNGIHDIFHDADYFNSHTRPVDRLVRDIEAGRLPAVTWVTPQFQLSDHPPASSGLCHNWVTEIVNAVMRSEIWEHTVIFITWDEWGGFFDPVRPPQVDDLGFGFRVPMLTISPYIASRGLVDDEVGEFSSPLKFIADNWGLRYLTPRIRKTHNFEHVFDFTRRPREPVIATRSAPTFTDDPFTWVGETYGGWPAGTVPVTDPW